MAEEADLARHLLSKWYEPEGSLELLAEMMRIEAIQWSETKWADNEERKVEFQVKIATSFSKLEEKKIEEFNANMLTIVQAAAQ